MKIKIILLFIAFYLGSLLITLPAEKIAYFIPDNTGIKVTAASGSLWNGKAAQITYKNQFQLQQISWQVDWSALVSLHLKLAVKFNNGSQKMAGKGFVILGFSGASIENFVLDVSAPELLSYTNLAVPVEARGDVSVVIKNASQGKPYCQELDGYVIWKDAVINSELGSVDLNSVNIDLSCDSGQLVADLLQDSNQLKATANFLLKENRLFQLQGLLKPKDKLEPDILKALSWLGGTNQSGEVILQFNGKL